MDEPKPARDRESVESGESSPSKVACGQESERGHEDKDGKPPAPELTKILVAVYHDKDDCHGIPALGPHPDAEGFEKNANYHYPDKNKKCECVNTEVDLKDCSITTSSKKWRTLCMSTSSAFISMRAPP
ncbi:hypothetical protein SCUP234_05914 [Seiridium cupressi]